MGARTSKTLNVAKIASDNGYSLRREENGRWRAGLGARVVYSSTPEGALATFLNRRSDPILVDGKERPARSVAAALLGTTSSVVTLDREILPPDTPASSDEPPAEGTPEAGTSDESEE